MKQLLFVLIAFSFATASFAQGKGNGKAKGNAMKGKNNQTIVVNNGTNTGSSKGYAKNQPKKVEAALYRDYPGATNVIWSKYQGDYTATFSNGPWRSIAVYHANGDRRDTRTRLNRNQLPGSVWDDIFRRDGYTPTAYERIERPSGLETIFRILSGNTAYYYNGAGNRVQYAY